MQLLYNTALRAEQPTQPMASMNKITISTLDKYKATGKKFTVVSAYDALFAKLIDEAGIDVILVGDTLGMVLQGHRSTLPVTMEDMLYHTQCVQRGTQRIWIMADMPFGSYANTSQALDNAAQLMRAGAHMVKLEGGAWLLDTMTALAQRSIPVCAHLGLTPQSVHHFGGFKVQGRHTDAANAIYNDALQVEAAGARLLVLECVPAALAKRIRDALTISVIGIGAGADTDAQVLVLHDILGLTPRPLRFVHNFLADTGNIPAALKAYNHAVKSGTFPAMQHSFTAEEP